MPHSFETIKVGPYLILILKFSSEPCFLMEKHIGTRFFFISIQDDYVAATDGHHPSIKLGSPVPC